RVAAPVPTNGNAKPAPPGPLLVKLEQSALAGAKAAVCALTPEVCRWPCGDPGHPDFHFCVNPVAKGSYCARHYALAYVTPRTGSELVAHGRRRARNRHLRTAALRPPARFSLLALLARRKSCSPSRAALPVAHSRPFNREAKSMLITPVSLPVASPLPSALLLEQVIAETAAGAALAIARALHEFPNDGLSSRT